MAAILTYILHNCEIIESRECSNTNIIILQNSDILFNMVLIGFSTNTATFAILNCIYDS